MLTCVKKAELISEANKCYCPNSFSRIFTFLSSCLKTNGNPVYPNHVLNQAAKVEKHLRKQNESAPPCFFVSPLRHCCITLPLCVNR